MSKKCKHESMDNWKYCPMCGEKLKKKRVVGITLPVEVKIVGDEEVQAVSLFIDNKLTHQSVHVLGMEANYDYMRAIYGTAFAKFWKEYNEQ